MTEEVISDAPGSRALGAMAMAARRSSGAVVDAPPTTVTRAVPQRPAIWRDPPVRAIPPATAATPSVPAAATTPVLAPAAAPGGPSVPQAVAAPPVSPELRRQEGLVRAITVATALVVLTSVTLAVVRSIDAPTPLSVAASTASATQGATRTGATAPRASAATPGHHKGSHTPSPSVAGNTVPIAVAEGSTPQINSLSPSAGGPGQTVTISGANFMSADGTIIARVNGQVAPTSCPAQSTCTVTVPILTGTPSGPVVVTVTTGAGPSNPERFTYQG